ncbi:GHKL domain-containing protein [Clostridium sp. BL-8]|uniref:sensor histidine kinase n=1 Tax=Clostridium sp. BL-8 TaxID=349938 RepID=UPI00098C1F80|nr:GHKL domain-containing protein [Clostridium sp. BL-8]OOM74020.1 sensor protein CitS [Clostridium sp. BL-8]
MLIHFIINFLDTFNIIYLWAIFAKKNNIILKLIGSTLTASVLMTITERLGIHFIVTYIIIILALKIFFERDLKDAILGFFFTAFIMMIFQLMLLTIMNEFISDDNIKGIITELIMLTSILVYSRMNISKKISYKKINSNILIYFISTFSIYASVIKTMWNYDDSIVVNNLLFIVLILSILGISQTVIYFNIVKGIKEREELRLSNEYNTVINEIVQEIKQRQHDFNNYKNTIKGIIEVVDEEKIKQTITDYIKDEDMNDNHINDLVYIDNVIIRSIVYNNLVKAKKFNVNLKYIIENDVLDDTLRYHDISNLLSNLLNNAFDEVTKDECVDKEIEVKIFKEKNISHLIIKNKIANSNNLNLNEIFARGYSTKDKGTRGYGLYNVQQIVNANKGYIKLNVENEELIFDIYFNKSSG